MTPIEKMRLQAALKGLRGKQLARRGEFNHSEPPCLWQKMVRSETVEQMPWDAEGRSVVKTEVFKKRESCCAEVQLLLCTRA